jgi:hypothetical protein
VDTQFAVSSVIAIKRFDHERAPWPMHDFWGSTCELVGDETIFEFDNAVVAKHPPCQGDCVCLGQGGDQIANLSIPHMNIQKFVNIQMHDPNGLFHGLLAICKFQGRKLNAMVIIGAIIAQMNDFA